MKFENDSARRDYLKRIAKNPNNVPGLPEFYPPLSTRSFTVLNDRVDEFYKSRLSREEKRMRSTKETELFCVYCERITRNRINGESSYCRSCNEANRYHN